MTAIPENKDRLDPLMLLSARARAVITSRTREVGPDTNWQNPKGIYYPVRPNRRAFRLWIDSVPYIDDLGHFNPDDLKLYLSRSTISLDAHPIRGSGRELISYVLTMECNSPRVDLNIRTWGKNDRADSEQPQPFYQHLRKIPSLRHLRRSIDLVRSASFLRK